jgi:uncharacterized protein
VGKTKDGAMRNYLPPGVYRAPQPPSTDDVRLVRTDIAGFVGYAERGPVAPPDSPTLAAPATLAVRVTSWTEYRAKFGGLTHYAYMPYAVRAFFENGGTTCWVVRVAASSSHQAFTAPRTASFTVPMRDDAVPVTTLSQAVNQRNDPPTLVVASTAGLAPGAVVGLGAAGALDLGLVATVPDAQHLTLTKPLAAAHGANDQVWLLAATVLSASVVAGQTDIIVARSDLFSVGDVVALTSPGMIEVAAVDGFVTPTTLRLSQKLRGSYAAGAFLRRQVNGLRLDALSPGNWGNRLAVDIAARSLPPKLRFDVRVTLAPGPDPTQPTETERFVDLSLETNDPRNALAVINDPANGSNLIRLSLPESASGSLKVTNGRIDSFPVTLAGGRDGLHDVTAQDFIGADGDFRGLRVLEEVAEVGILVAPDAANTGQTALIPSPKPKLDACLPPPPPPPPNAVADDPTAAPRLLPPINGVSGPDAVAKAMVDQARRLRYRVAVLDTQDNLEPTAVINWLQGLALPPASLQFGAVYYPWLRVPDGLTNELATRRVPPSGHVAGVFAQVDNASGVQHPPANVEVAFAVDVVKDLSGVQQGALNEMGINAIRSFPGRGIRVWGARSLAAGDDAQEKWWFIHVRRTMSMIEDSVEKSMQWTVFESNDHNLRRTLTHSLTVFLERLWFLGGLKGTTPDQAFYVKCDDTNNPQSQIDRGWLVCEVGVAVAAPMEFLTFQIRRLPDGAGVVED